MRVLPPSSARIRLGWLRPLARLVHDGVAGRTALAQALLSRHYQDAVGWTVHYSHYELRLTGETAPHIAQMAQLYGLSAGGPPSRLCRAWVAADPWPWDQPNPMNWDCGTGFLGFTALMMAHGDLVLPLLRDWSELLPPQVQVIRAAHRLLDSLPSVTQASYLRTALENLHGPTGPGAKNVLRPWLEPLLDLELLSSPARGAYQLAPRGVGLQHFFQSPPARLSLDPLPLHEAWVWALGYTPRAPTDAEIAEMLSEAARRFPVDQRNLDLQELALWAQAHWCRSAPGVALGAMQLRSRIGRPGFAKSVGVVLLPGVLPDSTFVSWLSGEGAIYSAHSGSNLDLTPALQRLDTAPEDPLPAAQSAPPSPRSPRLLAWQELVQDLLRSPGALACGGPDLALRRARALLSAPPGLLKSWREDKAWATEIKDHNSPHSPFVPLLSSLSELLSLSDLNKLLGNKDLGCFQDFVQRWRDVSASPERVRALHRTCEAALARLQAVLIEDLATWLSATDAPEAWPQQQLVTTMLLADAVLLYGHAPQELARSLCTGSGDSPREALGALLGARSSKYIYGDQLLVVGLRVLDKAHVDDTLTHLQSDAVKITLKQASDPTAMPAATLRCEVQVRLSASSSGQARHLGRAALERFCSRARFWMSTQHDRATEWSLDPDAAEPDCTLVDSEEMPQIPSPLPETRPEEGPEGDRGFCRKRPSLDLSALDLLDDPLLALNQAALNAQESIESRLTLLWVSLENLLPSAQENRAAEVQLRASELLARLALSQEAGALLRRVLGALYERMFAVSPDPKLYLCWERLRGPEETSLLRERAGTLAIPPRTLLGEACQLSDEGCLQTLLALDKTDKDLLFQTLLPLNPRVALDLDACWTATQKRNLKVRLRQERLRAAGALAQTYRVRNRMVHECTVHIGAERDALEALRQYLLPGVEALIQALMHPRVEGLPLTERWAHIQEQLSCLWINQDRSPLSLIQASDWTSLSPPLPPHL